MHLKVGYATVSAYPKSCPDDSDSSLSIFLPQWFFMAQHLKGLHAFQPQDTPLLKNL